MVRIRVPATTANIGSGFDSLGIALKLYNDFQFQELESGVEIIGFEEKYNNLNNLVYSSAMRAFEEMGHIPSGLRIKADINIPVARGLGSSAACIVAGIIGANILSGEPLGLDEILAMAVEFEGHTDNVTPAILGGLVTSTMIDGRVVYDKSEIKKDLKFLALVPDFQISTEEARAVLPKEIAYEDAVSNVSRIALLLAGLKKGKFPVLRYGLEDRLHQPYRAKLIKDFYNIKDKAEELSCLGAYLSGSGPSIMCLLDGKNEEFIRKMEDYLLTLEDKWEILELEVEQNGCLEIGENF